MRAGPPLALALFLLASLGAGAQTDGPVEAAAKFHEAQKDRPCSEVWTLYSKATQEHIRAGFHRLEQERGGQPDGTTPEGTHCRRIGKFKPGSARLVRQVGGEAVVSATFRGAPSSRYFDFGAAFREFTEELDLIREDGVWKAELPRPKLQSKQARLSVPIGVVDYRMDPVVGGIHHKLEVTVATRTPRDALDAVLRDPKAWAAALPSFKSIESLGRTGDMDRALLSFADPSPPIPVTVRLSGRPVDPKADWTSLEWNVEKDVDAPVYMRGSWTLKTNPDGTTRVNLTLVFNPRHWPRSESMFAATRLAKSLDNLERAAGRPY